MNIPLTPIRFLERTLKLHGNKIGLICEKERFTYREFGDRVNRLSNGLTRLGIGKGDRVSYLGYNCHRLLEGFFGIPQIGAILQPLNIRLVPADFEYILDESEPKILFLDRDFIPQIEAIRDNIPAVETFILLGKGGDLPDWISGTYDELLADASPEAPYPPGAYPFEEDDVAEIFYTSGTTGKPKGVMLTHRNLYLHAMAVIAAEPMDETDIQIHLIPLFHVNGWGTPHYLTAMGGTHVMVRKFDPAETMKIVQREKVTRFYIIPTMVNAILAHPDFADYNASSVRRVLVGGAPPPTGMIERVEKAFGCVSSTAFGMTEACPLIAWPELSPYLDAETHDFRSKRTWGFPLLGVEFRVVDPEGNDLPWDGESVGELLVRGDMVMKGYYRSPEETADALEGGWYHTGDLCAMGPDGSLYVKDRQKDIIISGGENISSLEVEAVLYSHPDILECAVIAKQDDKWGEIPLAFVAPKEGVKITPQQVIDFSREHLAHFKAPKEVKIIKEFPRGGTGKILKSVLREELKST
ncbi:MAG: long-chain-fatty-acid--CoA ligase [Deltaproteobacteria bacterium]|nr:long-chain-fatty-acid--CoA ligase [Deltaproteobacteria bacterium]